MYPSWVFIASCEETWQHTSTGTFFISVLYLLINSVSFAERRVF
jgi:hypothetical protein